MPLDHHLQYRLDQINNYNMCIIDEVHQLSLFQVSAVAHYVKFLLLLFDKAQKIAFNQQNNSKGKDCLVDSKIWYPWARCIYGGSHMLPWMCMEEKTLWHQLLLAVLVNR